MILSLLVSSFVAHAAQASVCSELGSQRQLDPGDKKLWSQDVNSDGLEDIFVQGECEDGACEGGLYRNCGPGRFVLVLQKEMGLADLVVDHSNSAFDSKWKNLKHSNVAAYEPEDLGNEIDDRDDLNDILSTHRYNNENRLEKFYGLSSSLGRPGQLAGHLEFRNGRYDKFYSAQELDYLWSLALKEDSQAGHIIFFKILRDDRDHPLYLKFAERFEKVESRRALLATGFQSKPKYIPDAWLKDTETRRNYIRANVFNLKNPQLVSALKSDPQLATAIVQYSGDNISKLPMSLQSNANLVEEALSANRSAFQYLPESFKNDSNKIITWCQKHKISLRYASDNVKRDTLVAKACVDARPINYQFVSNELKANVNIAEAALSRDGYLLVFAPDEIKANSKIVKRALASYPQGAKFLAPKNEKSLQKNQ